MDDLIRQGKVDKVCSVCGREEAYNEWCSNCGKRTTPDEVYVHRPGQDPRNKVGVHTPSCVLTGCPLPGMVNGGWGNPALALGSPDSAQTARKERARVSAQKRRKGAA